MNDVQERSANPFGDAPIAARPSGNAPALSDQQRSIAEVQAAMLIACMNPRDPVAAMDRILNACTRPTLAEAAVYQYSKGSSDVSGPSIRLAEAMAQQWGNIKTSVRELDQANGVSTVQTIAWDLETGYQCDKVFQVPHLRHTRNGAKRLEDPRDIYELVANQGARRLRACILAVIPGDVTEAAVAQCETTMKAKADTSPEGIKKILEAFAAFSVTKDQIEKRIQRRMDAIQPAQVVALKKIYASLRDGMSVPADWFEQPEATEQPQGQGNASAAAAVRDKLKQRQPPAAKPADTPPPHQEPAGATNAAPARPRYSTFADAVLKAPDRDAAKLAIAEANAAGIPDDQPKDLGKLADERWAT
jgi:hypothetical protein